MPIPIRLIIERKIEVRENKRARHLLIVIQTVFEEGMKCKKLKNIILF